MPTEITRYDIVLSCPTDVESEKEIIQSVIEDFNRTIGNNLNIILNLKHWSTDSYAQSGGAAQELLNKQFIDDSDMIICIFWGRMGTPTDNYESGTAEEMQKAIENGKQVFLYFSNAPINPRDIDNEQFARVKNFEEKIQRMDMAYYKRYDTVEEFKGIITTDLNLYFIQNQKSDRKNVQNKIEYKSDLVISGIEHKKIKEDIEYYNNYEKYEILISNLREGILKKIVNINDMVLPLKKVINNKGMANVPTFQLLKTQPYVYPDIYVETITEFSKTESVILNDNFFEIGDLQNQENMGYLAGFNSKYSLIGSDAAKSKQKEIKKLVYDIWEYLDWVDYSNQFKEVNFIRLALSNKGTMFESDITVKIKFPSAGYIPFSTLKAPGDSIIQNIINSEFIENTFGGINSVEVKEFDYPIASTISSISNMNIPRLPGYSNGPSYEDLVEDFFDQKNKMECYDEYEEDGEITQIYYFDELKQHTNISFPSVLLFNTSCSSLDIEYEIISKNNPEKKIGSISMK